MSIDLIETEVGRPSIFKDENKLTVDYLPDHLLFREEQMKALTNYLKGLILHPAKFTQRVVFRGGIGTGKTALAKKFGINFENIAKKYGVPLKYVHVNCRRKQTNFLVLLNIIHEFDPHFPSRGYSSEELLEILLKILERQNITILLCLDEIDFLISKSGPNMLYSLTRISDDEIEKKGQISLILIARDEKFRQFLDASTISSLQLNTISFEKYSFSQLQDILKTRAAEAFHQGTVSNETLTFIAELASPWGDARYAIELLWIAGKKADMQNSKMVLPEHVRYASASIHPGVQRDVLKTLSLHHLLLLLGVTRVLSKTDAPYSSIKEIEETYVLSCEEYNNIPRKYTQVWQYIQDLFNLGLLNLKVTSQGIRGRTTLVSLPNIPAKILETEIEQILRNKLLEHGDDH
ncbi:MAG: ORC1-type DNA replication protein [Candidatus Heimdallarchaeota archaeon]